MGENEQNAASFGNICLLRGFITREQLDIALEDLRVLEGRGIHETLGGILIAKGQLTPEQQEEALQLMASADGDVDRIGGFDIQSKLGSGGFGVIYMAKHTETGKLVALKILPPELALNQDYTRRFMREAGVLQTVEHPNIARCVGVGFDDNRRVFYYAREYVEGHTVKAMLEKEGAIEERHALEITSQVAQALQHAHLHGILHRDIKPSNILVTPDGTVKVLDFGIAPDIGHEAAAKLAAAGRFAESLHYASPEQVRADASIDTSTDIYSLGATLYHMVTGEPPYKGTPAEVLAKQVGHDLPWPKDVAPALSENICLLIEKMMAKDPNDRYASPKELLRDVAAIQSGHYRPAGILAPGRSAVNRYIKAKAQPARMPKQTNVALQRARETRKELAWLLAAVVGVVVVGALFIAFRDNTPSGKEPAKPAARAGSKRTSAPDKPQPIVETTVVDFPTVTTPAQDPFEQKVWDILDIGLASKPVVGKVAPMPDVPASTGPIPSGVVPTAPASPVESPATRPTETNLPSVVQPAPPLDAPGAKGVPATPVEQHRVAPVAEPVPPKKAWPPDTQTVQKLFRGQVRRFDPGKWEIELAYDFNNPVQVEDWALSRWPSEDSAGEVFMVKEGVLLLSASRRCALHKAMFIDGMILAAFKVDDGGVGPPPHGLGGGNVSLVVHANQTDNSYALHGLAAWKFSFLEKVTPGKRENLGAFVEISPFAGEKAGRMVLSVKERQIEGRVGDLVFKADDGAYASWFMGLWADNSNVSFDAVSIVGTIDRNWLASALLQQGLVTADDIGPQ